MGKKDVFSVVWDHLTPGAVSRFEHPAHSGKIDRADATSKNLIIAEAEAGLPTCGAAIFIMGAFDPADSLRIRNCRFTCLGGVLAIGVCEAACTLVEGIPAAEVPSVATLDRLIAISDVPTSRAVLCGIVRDAVCRMSRQARELALGGAYAATACRRVQLGIEEVNAQSKKQPAVRMVVGASPASSPINALVDLIVEKPLEIRVNGKAHSVTMHTPGTEDDELSLVAGLAFTDGVFSDFGKDVETMELDVAKSSVNVTLKPLAYEVFKKTTGMRASFSAFSSCALCGKKSLEEIVVALHQVDRPGFTVTPENIVGFLNCLEQHQTLYGPTRAAHAAAIFDASGKMISFAEDVGRHNALDRAIGRLVRSGKLPDAAAAAVSSRCSFEMMQKCVRASIAIVAGLSAATSQAVALAEQFGVSSVSVSFKQPITVTAYTHPNRIKF